MLICVTLSDFSLGFFVLFFFMRRFNSHYHEIKGAGKYFPAPLHTLNNHLTPDMSSHVVESTHSLEYQEYYHPPFIHGRYRNRLSGFCPDRRISEDGVAGLSEQTETWPAASSSANPFPFASQFAHPWFWILVTVVFIVVLNVMITSFWAPESAAIVPCQNILLLPLS